MFQYYDDYMRICHSNYMVITKKDGKERRSFHNLNDNEVKKVIDDFINEGALEVTNHDDIITATF